MNTWTNAIKQAFKETGDVIAEQGAQPEVAISGVEDVAKYNNMSIHSWSDEGINFMAGIGKLNDAKDTVGETLELLLEDFLGAEGSDVEFFAARHFISDDMLALEICGMVELEEEPTLFYGTVLTDDVESYAILGLSNGEPDHVFGEFANLARMFNRAPKEVTIENPKSDKSMFESLRNIAKAVILKGEQNVRNVTFEVENGLFTGNTTMYTTTKDGTEETVDKSMEENMDLALAIEEFLTASDMRHDIEAFTVTCFYDGRYSATFYPLYADEDEHEHGHDGCCGGHGHDDDDHECCGEHNHDEGEGCGCGGHDKKDKAESKVYNIVSPDEEDDEFTPANDELAGEKDMVENLPILATALMECIETKHKHYMGVIRLIDEGESYTLDLYTSDGGNFAVQHLDDKYADKLIDQLNLVGDITTSIAGAWDTFLFVFTPADGASEITAEDITYEIKEFDEYYDLSLDDNSEKLEDLASMFEEELNTGGKPYTSIVVELAMDDKGVFVLGSPTAYGVNDITRLDVGSEVLEKLYGMTIEAVFNDEVDSATLVYLPSNRLGVYVEARDGSVKVTAEDYELILPECGLSKYADQLKTLQRSEIYAEAYEVLSDDSLGAISKAGGSPDLASEAQWPKASDDVYMNFITQINLAEAAQYDVKGFLPKNGMLSFFYDDETGESQVIYNEDVTKLVRVPSDDMEDTIEYFPCAIRLDASVSLPNYEEDDNKFGFLGDDESIIDSYIDISTFEPRFKMFGYADYIDYDMETSEDMYLLMQVPSLEGCAMAWGDGGALYFMIDKKDLENKDFSRVKCYKQTFSYEKY